MPTTTTNYGFTKPSDSDTADIQVINDNWDMADAKIKEAADAALNAQSNSIPNTAGSVTDALIGNRTVDQATVTAYANTGGLAQILSWFAKMIKTITGKTNWYDTPSVSLEGVNTHINASTAHGAVSIATASKMMVRDSAGRAKVAAPSAADDIARLDTVTAHTNLTTTAHGGIVSSADVTTVATANKLLKLNASGQFPADITGNAATATTANNALAVGGIAADNIAKFAKGTYTGDGTTVSRAITVGFTPKLVKVYPLYGTSVTSASGHILVIDSTSGGRFLNYGSTMVTCLTLAAASLKYGALTSNGFVLGNDMSSGSTADWGGNESGTAYMWEAIG